MPDDNHIVAPRGFVLWCAAGIALIAGVLEPPLLLLRRELQDLPIEGDAQMLWMAPLAYLLAFLPLGAVLELAVRSTRRASLVRVAVFILCTLALFALLTVFRRFHSLAWLMLAAGVSVQLTGMIFRHLPAVHRWTRRTVIGLGGAVMVAGAAITAYPAVREARARRAAAAPDDALSVLLLVLDTVRAKSLSLAGYSRPTTPELDAWAAEGAYFVDATVTSPWTLPSHGGMFTALYPHELEAGFQTPLESGPRTLAEELARLGFATAGFVSNRRYGSQEFGLDRGFDRYVVYRPSLPQILISSSVWRRILWHPRVQDALGYYDLYGRASAATLNRELLEWIDDLDRPFFAFVNYYEAHEPYLPPSPYDRRFTDDPRRGRPGNLEKYSPDVVLPERDMYESTIAYLDAQLGLLRAELAERGLLDRTVVIITSDHGEQFGEHGMTSHGNSLYSPLLNVPLVMIHPSSVPAALRIEEPVTLRDLPATVMRLAAPNTPNPFPGSSLTHHWESEFPSSAPSPILAALTWQDGSISYALRDGPLLYIDWFQEREELYDLRHDPDEEHDLAQDPDFAARLDEVRSLKDSLVGHIKRPRERGM